MGSFGGVDVCQRVWKDNSETDNMEVRETKGFALPAAVFALVIMAILVTAGFYASQQEYRVGVATENGTEAFYVAERGAMEVMAEWSSQGLNGLAVWGNQTVNQNVDGGNYAVTVTRLNNAMFFLDSRGTMTEGGALYGGASRRVGWLVRLTSAQIEPPAALTTRGTVSVRGTAEVSGFDIIPPGWGAVCTDPLVDKPGILIDDLDEVSSSGQGEVDGVPAVAEDPTLDDTFFTEFGDLTWDDLKSLATINLGGGNINNTGPSLNADGTCNTGDSLNWGDPLDPSAACGSYFPMIYINGTARIQAGGVGQGILLVDGTLDLRGNFIWHGIIIVQGNFETQGNGNRVLGGVLASNADLDLEKLVGGSIVQNSTCAVSRALLNNTSLTRVRPLDNRSFVDLSAIIN